MLVGAGSLKKKNRRSGAAIRFSRPGRPSQRRQDDDSQLHPRPKSFFFQAEDGIRDLYVTGVQTCALPIWNVGLPFFSRLVGGKGLCGGSQIGRASCRERVWILGVAVSLKRKNI